MVRHNRRHRHSRLLHDTGGCWAERSGGVLPAWLAGIPTRIGYSGDGRRWMLTHRRPPEFEGRRRKPVPMPLYYQRLLDLVGIPEAGPDYIIPPTDDDRAVVDAALTDLGRDPAVPLVA